MSRHPHRRSPAPLVTARRRLLVVVAVALVALSAELLRARAGGVAWVGQDSSDDCVRFQSPGRLNAGTPFRIALLRGLEFRLSDGWSISVGPIAESTDYLWVVSPPLRTAPHLMIGTGYGLTPGESARIGRALRFVLTRADYDAAMAAIERGSAEESLKRMAQLGRGRLTLVITDFRVRKLTLDGGRELDVFDWITFEGEACIPKG